MKNKNLIILFFVLLILIYPLEKAYAQGLLDVIGEVGKRISDFFGNIGNAIKAAGECFGNPIFCGMALFINVITWIFHQILWFFNLNIFAFLVDKASELDPFYSTETGSPATVAWSILVSYGFIILVFSGLSVAYDWLFGQDATALRKIFIIIFVALIINFTFVGIQETFKIIRSFEKGITNNQSEMIGTIMAASLWQKDPFQTINQIAETIQGNSTFKYLTQAILYLFIVAFDMGMSIILIVTLVLFIVRYFYILALTVVSPLAVASLTFPEFQNIPALREFFSGLRFTGEWFSLLVKWLLVVPIFVILVLLCNITKENILAQIGNGDIVQFIMLFLGFTVCYAGSLKVAVSLGGIAAAWAKGIATALLLAAGALAAKGIFRATQGTIGRVLTKAGSQLEEKVGVGGTLGWRSWVGQKIGKPVRQIGEKMVERKYGLEAESVKSRIATIEEQLRRETDPTKIQNLTSQLSQLIQKYKGNNYVLKSINESIKKMPSYSAAKTLASAENLESLASPDVPQETRETVIGLVDKLRKGDLKKMAGDTKILDTLRKISPDVADAFFEKMGKELKEADGLEIISKDEVRNFIAGLKEDDSVRKTFNFITKGFVEALLKQNIEQISNIMASWDKDVWLRPENTQKIKQIFDAYELKGDQIRETILKTIEKAEDREAFIRAALKEEKGGFLRKTFAGLSDPEINRLGGLLRPQFKDSFETIILEESESQAQKT